MADPLEFLSIEDKYSMTYISIVLLIYLYTNALS